MHCYGMSQSITDRFAAVVEVFFFPLSLSIHDKVLLFTCLFFFFFVINKRVSLRSVGDDGTNCDEALG